jgi:hypothetical protein
MIDSNGGQPLSSRKPDVYTEFLSDWITFRRTFAIETEINAEAIRRELVASSTPPPPDGNPLSVTTPVAVTRTANDALLFEINVARGLPIQDGYYVPFKAVGRVVEQDNKQIMRGEIRPLWQGVLIYVGVVAALLLWLVASVTSAAVSPYGTYVGVWVALGTTLMLSGYMLMLQWRDMRRLVRLLRVVTSA